MCGIAGLHCRTDRYKAELGALIVPMLDVLSSRGPDSTGVAMYSHDLAPGECKYSLCAPTDGYDWSRYVTEVEGGLGVAGELKRHGRDAVLVLATDTSRVLPMLRRADPDVRIFGFGSAMEVFKDVGSALEVCERFGVGEMSGYQAIGHTRMATESAVTTEHSHPFAAGADLALVHNGSFSNYATVRRRLRATGVVFDTDNDSEVAARFIAEEVSDGATLEDAMHGVLKVFDGFFTLLVATGESFSVMRDSFACKPMVIAETDDYVAAASEYVALADLPDIEKAEVFEPMPGEIYTWQS